MDHRVSEANKECEVELVLPSTTPVVGCRIYPDVCDKFEGTPTVRSLSFGWFLPSPFLIPNLIVLITYICFCGLASFRKQSRAAFFSTL